MTSKDPMVMALKKLSRRWYSKKEISDYLYKNGFDEEISADVINKLIEWGYLNDSRLAGSILTHYTSIKLCGRRLIAQKMNIRGIPPEMMESTLESYSLDKELVCCRHLAHSYASRKNLADRNNLISSLSRFLERKGFSTGMILKIIRETEGWQESGPLDSPIN